MSKLPDRHEYRTVKRVTDDGDGDVTVYLDNDSWLTVRQDELPAMPKPGDRVVVRLPQIVSMGGERKEVTA